MTALPREDRMAHADVAAVSVVEAVQGNAAVRLTSLRVELEKLKGALAVDSMTLEGLQRAEKFLLAHAGSPEDEAYYLAEACHHAFKALSPSPSIPEAPE